MRIGIDMMGTQSPASRDRGIGRYTRSLVSAMTAASPSWEFLLYAHHGLPTDGFPDAPNATVRPLPPAADAAEAVERLAQTDPDRLDVLLLTSPFDLHDNYDPPAAPLHRPAMAAVLYDLVAFLYPEEYLTFPPAAMRFYRKLERLRRYDRLLAISGATRADALRLLGDRPDQVVNIRGASDPGFFRPEGLRATPAGSSDELRRLGIDRPFVLNVAGLDGRKNLRGLIDAYGMLDARLKDSHQLVIAYGFGPEESAEVRRHATARGVGGSLVLAGAVPDETLRRLYQRCEVFAFPSLFEGFGLPLLEAMHCGAAVIGGKNSAQVEVVGDAGLLVNARDPADIASALARVLRDPGLADRLRALGPERAREFSWESTAGRAIEALSPRNDPQERRVPAARRRPARPRIALFSPWPPKGSGIADYALRLARELRRTYTVDLYHDAGYEPDLGTEAVEFGVYDHRLYDRNAAIFGYRGVLYQMGNSLYHGFVYDALLRYPGVVTLHDFCLAGFHHWYEHRPGGRSGHLREEVERFLPDQDHHAAWGDRLAAWEREEGGLGQALASRGFYVNRSLFDNAEHVIVHSRWCREKARELCLGDIMRTTVVPFGATPRLVTPERRAALRERFALPVDGLVFGTFGLLHPSKLNVETVVAFATVQRARPNAWLVFVGKDLEQGAAASRAVALNLGDRVRYLGPQSAEDYEDLLGVVDVGVCLRKPPTNGETSAALLDLLRHGVATVVTDVDAFGDYPDDVVTKVSWPAEGTDGLAQAMLAASDDRAVLGRSALSHIAAHHAWPIAASLYADVIERCAAERGGPVARGTAMPSRLRSTA